MSGAYDFAAAWKRALDARERAQETVAAVRAAHERRKREVAARRDSERVRDVNRRRADRKGAEAES